MKKLESKVWTNMMLLIVDMGGVYGRDSVRGWIGMTYDVWWCQEQSQRQVMEPKCTALAVLS